MLRVYSITYRIMLTLALLFSLIAKFVVGAAGHNLDSDVSDYIFIAYCIITIITLSAYTKAKSQKLKKGLRFLNMLLVLFGIFSVGYGQFVMIYDGDFIASIIIPLFIFIIAGLLLFVALIKDKI